MKVPTLLFAKSRSALLSHSTFIILSGSFRHPQFHLKHICKVDHFFCVGTTLTYLSGRIFFTQTVLAMNEVDFGYMISFKERSLFDTLNCSTVHWLASYILTNYFSSVLLPCQLHCVTLCFSYPEILQMTQSRMNSHEPDTTEWNTFSHLSGSIWANMSAQHQ